MAVSFEALLWSLTMQESGGRYNAVGPQTKYGRAYGRYQVLAPNIGPWTSKYYGKRLTPSQFLANHAAQDAVVRGVLKGYYDRYGAAGAASMWYSGQPNSKKTYGNPPVYKYVNSVLSRASGYKGGSSTPTGSTSKVPTVAPKLDSRALAESYGLTSAMINSSKELKALFARAVSKGYSAERFQAELKNTKWWRTQSNTLREYLTLKYTDPATWKQNIRAGYAKYNALAVATGTGNQMHGNTPTKWLKAITYKGVALGWSDERIKNWIGQYLHLQGGVMTGEAGEVFDQLHELAYNNGQRPTSDWYLKAVKGIIGGIYTMETAQGRLREQAAAQFPGFAEQIRAGQSALSLAQPYVSSVAQLLELPETDVDLFNKHVSNAMKKGDAKTPYSIWQFENDLRADPLWRKTNNARENMFQVAHQVARDFGMAF